MNCDVRSGLLFGTLNLAGHASRFTHLIVCLLAVGYWFWVRPSAVLLLRSESPSGKCAKLHTLAAGNNRDHPTRSLYNCLFAPQITWVLFFAPIPFVVNGTFNATPTEKLQHYQSFAWIGTMFPK